MHWIVQRNLNEEGFGALARAIEVLDLPHTYCTVVPYAGRLEPDPQPAAGERVVVMGAYTMLRVARERGWSPGAFIDDNFDYEVQRRHWGDRLLNADATFTAFGALPEQQGLFFVRPTHDSKVFAGKVVDWTDFWEWRERVRGLDNPAPLLNMDTPIMAAPLRTIWREYRTWVVDGRVVTASLYKEGEQVRYDALVPDDVVAYAEDCARVWSPHRAYVLDVAETPDCFRIVEVNCLNSAGFYAGNIGRLVQAIEDAFGRGP